MIDFEELQEFHDRELGKDAESLTERKWLAWVKECERSLGHDLDGNDTEEAKRAGTADGFSLDEAYAAWEAGWTADRYTRRVQARERYTGQKKA